jgi:hypothetical protein
MKTTKNENSTDIETFLNNRDMKLYRKIIDKIETDWKTIEPDKLSQMVDILDMLNKNIQNHIQNLKSQELFKSNYRKIPKESKIANLKELLPKKKKVGTV